MARKKTLTFKQFIKELGELTPNMEEAVIKGLRSASQRGVAVVVQSINTPTSMTHAAVDTGMLARSVEATDLPRGGQISVDAPHAAVMEFGARPFYPPIVPLFDWAKRKFGVDDDEAKAIAYAVREHIAIWGIEPRHYLKRSMRRIRKMVPIEVESELRKL